jgi:hypothetical protein
MGVRFSMSPVIVMKYNMNIVKMMYAMLVDPLSTYSATVEHVTHNSTLLQCPEER